MNHLTNKRILITGASQGIGAELARTLAEHGATVLMLARSIPNLKAVSDEIIQAGHPEPLIIPMDLLRANPDDYQGLAMKIAERFGSLDGLVHNAGYFVGFTPIEHYDVEKWYQALQVKLHAPFLLTRALLPLLKRADEARILFTTGLAGKAYAGAHGVANQGLTSLTETLSEECEHTNIKIFNINPGPVKTPMRGKAFPAEDQANLPTPKDIMPKYLDLFIPCHSRVPKSRGTGSGNPENEALFSGSPLPRG